MENPFVKLVREGGETSTEELVTDTNFEVRDDGVYVQDVFEGGRVGEWKMLYENPTDSAGSKERYKEYRKSRGIVEENELSI